MAQLADSALAVGGQVTIQYQVVAAGSVEAPALAAACGLEVGWPERDTKGSEEPAMKKGNEPAKAGKPRPKKSEPGPPPATGTPEEQLAGFLARFNPEVAAQAEAALAKMRTLLPGAVEMVYDNYNALAIGFGETEKASLAPFSIAVFPRRPSLCFLRHGAVLPDPEGILQGGGNQVRSVPVVEVEVLDRPAVRTLIDQALELAGWKPQPGAKGRMVIKSISAKQRPRR